MSEDQNRMAKLSEVRRATSERRRKENEAARAESAKNERYFHFDLRTKGRDGRMHGAPMPHHYDVKVSHKTVYARKNTFGSWATSVAYCSQNDQFCRKTGRTTARRRFFQGTLVMWPVKDESKGFGFEDAKSVGLDRYGNVVPVIEYAHLPEVKEDK